MSATRRLDILAAIGGILAVAAIVIPILLSRSYNVPQDQWREIALRGMPHTDMRADFELLTEWPWGKDALPEFEKTISRRDADSSAATDEYEKQKRLHMLPVLAEAVRRFPDSARIQFRLGTLGDERLHEAALRKAADLDPKNAYPLYALAGAYAGANDYVKALQVLSLGNRRPYATWYPIPYEVDSDSTPSGSLVSSANSTAQLPALLPARRAAVQLGKYADKLRLSGDNRQALAISDQVRQMGWRLMRQDQTNHLDLLVAEAIVQIAEKPEKLIYTATGDKAGLSRIKRDEREFVRLRAGSHAYIGQLMENLVQRVSRFAGFGAPVATAGAAASALTILSLIWWGVLAVRSRGQSASELHQEATKKAFTDRKLPSLYAMMLAVIVASTLVLVRASYAGPTVIWLVEGTGALVCALSVVAVQSWAGKAYRRRYQQVAESAGETVAKPWKEYPIADKRERQRRLTGVMGGVMIALAIWGVVLSAYMKTAMNAYPWQMDRATAGLHQQETKYVHDLVAGKIKVPEKYIQEVEKQEAARKK